MKAYQTTSVVLVAVIGTAVIAFLPLMLNNYLLQVGTSLAMLAALGYSWNIVGGYMGYPLLGTATLFGLGIYINAVLQVHGVQMHLAWLGAAVGGGLFSIFLGYALLRMRGHYFAVGTIVTVEVVREIVNNWDSLTGGAVGLNLPILAGSPDFVSRYFFYAMWGLCGVAILTTFVMDRSFFGFGLRCIKQNETAASMVGVRTFRYKMVAFVLSSILAAMAGAIYASMVAFVEPKDAFNIIMSIEVPVMVMLGGMGTVLGPLVGSIIYVLLKELVWANFINWHAGILGVLVIIVIYFMPSGLLGINLRSWFRRRGVRPRTPQSLEA